MRAGRLGQRYQDLSTPGVAVPGTNVPASSLVTPGGAQGLNGLNSFNITNAAFTVPAIGATATVTLNDTSWCVAGETVYVAGAGGTGVAAPLVIQSVSGSQLTLLNPTPPANIPLASTAGPGLLTQVSGLTTDYVGGDNACHDIGGAIKTYAPIVRSYNAVGNPNFEVDARTVGVGSTGTTFALDRWYPWIAGPAGKWAQVAAPGGVLVSGTNFAISGAFLRFTLTTAKATLAAGDLLGIYETIEGARFRELIGGPTSGLLVVRSSVAGMTVTLSLRDPANAWSIVQILTLSNANVWTPLSFPNFPVWSASGNFSLSPGVAGYVLGIAIGCGSQYTAGATNVWQSGNFVAAPGQTNFGANPVNSTFDLAYVGHEPGSVSNGVLDLDFPTNLWSCGRYFQKSYPYATPAGSTSLSGQQHSFCLTVGASAVLRPNIVFNPPMAKAPTVTFYNNQSGAANGVYVDYIGAATISGSVNATEKSVGYGTLSASMSGSSGNLWTALVEWVADTGW